MATVPANATALADFPQLRVLAQLLDDTDHFMAGNAGVRICPALNDLGFAVTDATGLDAQAYLTLARLARGISTNSIGWAGQEPEWLAYSTSLRLRGRPRPGWSGNAANCPQMPGDGLA